MSEYMVAYAFLLLFSGHEDVFGLTSLGTCLGSTPYRIVKVRGKQMSHAQPTVAGCYRQASESCARTQSHQDSGLANGQVRTGT